MLSLFCLSNITTSMNEADIPKSTSRSLVLSSYRGKELARCFTFDMPEHFLLLLIHLINVKALLDGLFDDLFVLFMLIIALLNLLIRDGWVGLKNPPHESHILSIDSLGLLFLVNDAQ